jgi:hypothetical protein
MYLKGKKKKKEKETNLGKVDTRCQKLLLARGVANVYISVNVVPIKQQ